MTDSQKLDLVLSKMDMLGSKIETLETRMDAFEARMDAFETRMETFETRMETFETRMETLETRVDALETLKADVKDMKMMLENEICVNIRRIAEGHLDLARNLKEVQKPNAELELLSVRVTKLESDVRELKQKIS